MSEAIERPDAEATQEPSPLAIGSVVWRVGSRVRATVVLKAAFGYTPSGEFLLLNTPELHRVDQRSEDGSQVTAACDLAPFIRSPEVLVVGRAHGKTEKVAVSLSVERDGQKKMVIGNKGEKIKTIGTEARIDMERLFQNKVFLELWVKVKAGWADDERALRSLGYGDD